MEEKVEVQNHLQKVDQQIAEINQNQSNERLRKIELEAVIEGAMHFLKKKGFSSREIDYIMVDSLKKAYPERYGYVQ